MHKRRAGLALRLSDGLPESGPGKSGGFLLLARRSVGGSLRQAALVSLNPSRRSGWPTVDLRHPLIIVVVIECFGARHFREDREAMTQVT